MFNQYIWNPCKAGDAVGVAKLKLVMRYCTLRRTKESKAENGQKILNLPRRKEQIAWITLRDDEREKYDARNQFIKDKVAELQSTGTLNKNYANVLTEVLRLRQICNHVDLAMTGAVEEDYDGTIMDYEIAVNGIKKDGLTLPRAQSVVSFLKDGDGAVCVGCQFDYGDCFPSVGLIGVEEQSKNLKKLPHRPILTKCLHIYCES